jgi:hypothetical protein
MGTPLELRAYRPSAQDLPKHGTRRRPCRAEQLEGARRAYVLPRADLSVPTARRRPDENVPNNVLETTSVFLWSADG